jgi:hypothetical protein
MPHSPRADGLGSGRYHAIGGSLLSATHDDQRLVDDRREQECSTFAAIRYGTTTGSVVA